MNEPAAILAILLSSFLALAYFIILPRIRQRQKVKLTHHVMNKISQGWEQKDQRKSVPLCVAPIPLLADDFLYFEIVNGQMELFKVERDGQVIWRKEDYGQSD